MCGMLPCLSFLLVFLNYYTVLCYQVHFHEHRWHSGNEALAHNIYELMRYVIKLQALLCQTESDAEEVTDRRA